MHPWMLALRHTQVQENSSALVEEIGVKTCSMSAIQGHTIHHLSSRPQICWRNRLILVLAARVQRSRVTLRLSSVTNWWTYRQTARPMDWRSICLTSRSAEQIKSSTSQLSTRRQINVKATSRRTSSASDVRQFRATIQHWSPGIPQHSLPSSVWS